jgi:Gly-Xaa carboxypeptidase
MTCRNDLRESQLHACNSRQSYAQLSFEFVRRKMDEKRSVLHGSMSGDHGQFEADERPQITTDRARSERRNVVLLLTLCIILSLFSKSILLWELARWHAHDYHSPKSSKPRCVQVDPVFPSISSEKLKAMDILLASEQFRNGSIERLSNAVKIPTESFDDLGEIGEDPRWDVMYNFEKYLRKTFPRVFSKLGVELVNTHGLFITWNGTNASLKPTLLMAHQDVVPVPASTVKAWTHSPFSGYYDGEYVWGRGSSDCKNQLIAVLEAVELLLAADYEPKRSILLSFGFDEEVKGGRGAGSLAPFILDRYGRDGVAVLVDEGATFGHNWGAATAIPGVGEKGYIDVEVTIRMPGGHSSIPSPHTSIGVMAELVTLIEADTYEPYLAPNNPFLSTLHCGAEHSPDFPNSLRKALKRANEHQRCKKGTDHLAEEAAKESLETRYLMQTSVATDIIAGGVKNNALPERTFLIVNHRVNIGESTDDVKAKLTHLARGVAKKHNLTLSAFEDEDELPSSIMLRAPNTLEPAPVTPTNIDVVSPYKVLSGTVRALYGTNVTVAPGIMTGNTDTR